MNVQKMLIVIYGLAWTKVQLLLHLHRHDYHDQSLIRGIGADNSVMYYSPFVDMSPSGNSRKNDYLFMDRNRELTTRMR